MSSAPVVLILEDDQTLAAAMIAFLKKRGINAVATARSDEAKEHLRSNHIKLMFVDCLLPSENGVDFVQSIRAEHPTAVLDVVLMSGIFTEGSFVKDSITSTEALDFLKKPFKVEEIDSFIASIAPQVESKSPRKQLYQAFGNETLSARDKRKLFESLEDMHGFDLPYIYSFLIHSKVSGHLNVVDGAGHVFGITASNGAIVGVDLADSDTFLGKLLIESGYILPEDLEEVLNMKSSKRIGEKLIQSYLLSPHGFEAVLANQMSIRLSRTILDQTVKVNFVASEVESTTPAIDNERLERFIHDWVASKLSNDWLKAHFTQWGNALLVKGSEFKLDHPAFKMPLVSLLPNLVDVLMTGATLNEILDQGIFDGDKLLKAVHFLLCTGVLTLKDRPKQRNAESQRKHLRNIHHQVSGKNTVEVFGLMVRMTAVSESNPDMVYQEFITLLGVTPTADQKDIVAFYSEIKKLAKETLEAVKSGSHLKMKDQLMRGEIEKKLQASKLFEEARILLEKSSYSQALQILSKVEKLDEKFAKLHLHMAWARIGTAENASNKMLVFKNVDNDLMLVDPEEKFDALFGFVTGLYAKAKGDLVTARRSFEKATAMDPSLIAARRELAVIASLQKAKPDVFNQDLKSLVGSLFSRKK